MKLPCMVRCGYGIEVVFTSLSCWHRWDIGDRLSHESLDLTDGTLVPFGRLAGDMKEDAALPGHYLTM